MPIRYHLDENVDPAVAAGLRQRGVDVSVSREEGLLGVDDLAQLRFAAEAGRVLVTHDHDFLRLAATGVAHAGIAYAPPQVMTIGEMVRKLMVFWRERDATTVINLVEYL